MTQTWKIAVTASAISSPTYEAALEPFSIALSIYEADTDLPKTRGLPEPANWAGDLWLAEACIVEGIDRKSTRLNSSHSQQSRMPSSA